MLNNNKRLIFRYFINSTINGKYLTVRVLCLYLRDKLYY